MTLNKPFEINVYVISKESLNVIEIKVSMSQSSFLCYAFQKEWRKLEAVARVKCLKLISILGVWGRGRWGGGENNLRIKIFIIWCLIF